MDALALYEATRGVWRLGDRRKGAKLGFTVYGREIIEVYTIDEWLPAGTLPYRTRPSKDFDKSRWEFRGRVADEAIRNKYIGRTVSPVLLRGSNPTIYTWKYEEV